MCTCISRLGSNGGLGSGDQHMVCPPQEEGLLTLQNLLSHRAGPYPKVSNLSIAPPHPICYQEITLATQLLLSPLLLMS